MPLGEIMNVVVVDDSRIHREGVVNLISELPGINIVGNAGNSIDAIRVVQKTKPDLVILDIKMPGESGIEILKKIKKINRAAVVIILTNYPGKQYKAECYKAGVDYIFDKSLEFKLVPVILGKLQQGHLY